MSPTLVSYEVEIDAPAEIVYELLTTSEGLVEWIAVEADVDLRPGGAVRWTHANGQTVVGEWLEIAPPHRLVFTYGREGGQPVDRGTTVVEVTLTQLEAARTLLRLDHRDLPDEHQESHLQGWRHFGGQLAIAAAGRWQR